MTTATKFTMARLALIPVFLICMYLVPCNSVMQLVALVIFAAASLTDLIDGKIARKYNQVTDLGKFLDPLADKVLVIAAMAMFCEWGRFPAWALMIVLFREFAVSGLRMGAAGKGRVIAAGKSGKVKTAVTMAGICLMLFFDGTFFGDLLNSYICGSFTEILRWVIIALITVTTLYSGVEYFLKNRDALSSRK